MQLSSHSRLAAPDARCARELIGLPPRSACDTLALSGGSAVLVIQLDRLSALALALSRAFTLACNPLLSCASVVYRVQVALEVYDMQGHVFQNEVGENPVAQEAVRRIADFARIEIARSGTVPSMAPRL
jgi:hypothetical protein